MAVYNANRREHAADMDMSGFLIGEYTAIGVNNPKKYPRKPLNAEKILKKHERKQEMTDDEMKQTMMAFAKANNAALGVKNNGLLGETGGAETGGGR